MLDRQIDEQEYIIFASDADSINTVSALTLLGVNYKPLKGRYKGVDEDSYIVNKRDHYSIDALIKNQESILELSKLDKTGNRMATLVYKDGRKEPIGYVVDVPKEEAEAMDAYTLDPSTGTYFVAKQEV